MEHLISVIIPIYKVEKYLSICIESIINQTYKNLEIILVDDGSPDNCGKICDEYAKKDRRIKVIHKENGGLSSARNAGLDIASGEFISFVDSDDYISKKFIETLYNICKENKVDIAECDFLKFDHELNNSQVMSTNIINIYSQYEMQENIYNNENVKTIVIWNKLYKKYIFDTLRFPEGKINEDEFVTYKIFYYCKTSIATTYDKLYFYRYNPNSIMGRKFNIKRLDVLEAFEERKEFYKEKKEKELYEMTIIHYQDTLKYYYILTKEKIEKPKKYLKMIKLRLLNNFKIYKRLSVPLKEITKNYFFTYIPEIYCYYIKTKNNYKELKARKSYDKYKNYCKKIHQKEFLIFNTPLHGNIGDHAILQAERKLLNDCNIESFEIPTIDEKYYYNYIKQNIPNDAIVMIHGGGFIGSQWQREEELVIRVIDDFSKHKIIIFPQTIYFKNDEFGKYELYKSIMTINKAKDITIFTREEQSYRFALNNYKNANIKLVPDIVLYLDKIKFNFKREKILLCFRKDAEKKINFEEQKKIEEEVMLCENYQYTDTVINKKVLSKNSRKEVYKKLKEFARAKLIITDRLHGMIFSYLTNTPCIVLSNYNHKVKGVYEWINDKCNYIIFEDNINNIKNDIQILLNITCDEEKYKFKFDDLKNILNNI